MGRAQVIQNRPATNIEIIHTHPYLKERSFNSKETSSMNPELLPDSELDALALQVDEQPA